MAEPAAKRWTIEEFLAWDDGTDRRYELVGGEVVAMAPTTQEHSAIVSNLDFEIRSRLKPPCRALVEAGVQVPGRTDAHYEADLVVTCTPLSRGLRHTAEPVLIAEVLSPSTAVRDRGLKLDDYRRIPSVREILLVSSEERRVQHWRRDGERWVVEDRIGDAELRLETVAAPIPLAAIYEGSGI